MKITLSKVKYAAFASEETACFEAIVHIDGTTSFKVQNDGHGGGDYYGPVNRTQTMAHVDANVQRVEDFAKTLPERDYGDFKMPRSCESLVAEQLDAFLAQRDLKRLLNRRIAFLKAGALAITTLTKAKPADLENPAFMSEFNKRYPGALILNRMPVEAALELFMRD